MQKYFFDAVIVGAGGAGMRAALQLSQSGVKCALISKVFPTRSHTVSAQGGITVALGNSHQDDWQWHMFDTVKGSDYLGDQDAIEYMCKEGPDAILEMEHLGLPFSRLDDGRIYQRPFGGQSKNFGGEQAARTAAAADRTGHALLHTLYQQNVKHKTTVYTEWYALDLVKNNQNQVVGVTAIDIETGELAYFGANSVVLATGGAGRIYASTTNAHINTGDGVGMALRAGAPVQDMEMWQFHPTGIAGAGSLVTEGCRGEGGYLINKDGERFMERYAPNVKDLASRDVVSRAMIMEIREGRGFKDQRGDHIKLKLDHLGKDVLEAKLPGILDLARTFGHVDPVKEPIPVVPTCHYMMGGIPTNIKGQVIQIDKNGNESIMQGLYACGEVACVSVHGANRLGGNSLLDLVVFGKATGKFLTEEIKSATPFAQADNEAINDSLKRYSRWETNPDNGDSTAAIREDMQRCMQLNFSVFRDGESMKEGLVELAAIKDRIEQVSLSDKSLDFNTQRIESLELDNLFETAISTAHSANFREESRGTHSRADFVDRNDTKWLCHTLYRSEDNVMSKRDVNMTPTLREGFAPKARTY